MRQVSWTTSWSLPGCGICWRCNTGTPLQQRDAPKIAEKDIVRETITTETIYNCVAAPPPDAIKKILNTLLGTKDVTSCLTTINSIKTAQGLALADIVTALSEELVSEELAKLEVKPEVMITWLDALADIEHRISSGANEVIQTGAVVGAVRNGVELMG
jgi:replication factor C subunit 3/5